LVRNSTGLGLAICKQLTEIMQGNIGVNSDEGIGTEFWFTIPLLLAENRTHTLSSADSGDSISETVTQKMGIYEKTDCFRGKHLLIVDSNLQYCNMLSAHAVDWGMSVACASSCPEALKEFERRRQCFDVVLFTHILELESGLKISDQLKLLGKDGCQNIMVTDAKLGLDSTALNEHGIRATLEKPFGIAQFRNCVATVLGHAPQPGKSAPEMPSLDHLSVLVAEDNSVNQLVICTMLRLFGISPTVVNNGEEAVEAYRQMLEEHRQFGMVIMDMEMPVLDGARATAEIRDLEKASEGTVRVPIVALSAHALDDSQSLALQQGMDDYITKPLNLQRLESVLLKYAGTDGEPAH
jgi:two-component system, sensor histidine kinase and response regulator